MKDGEKAVPEKDTEKVEPFFARYLEGQDFPVVHTDVKAGKLDQTMKAPSDKDEI